MEICRVNFGGLNYVIFIGGFIIGYIASVIFLRYGNDGQNTNIENELDGNENEVLELKKKISILNKEAEVLADELNELKNRTESLEGNSLRIVSDSTKSKLDESQIITSSHNLHHPITLGSSLATPSSIMNNNASDQNLPMYFSIPSDDTGRFDLINKKEIYDKDCYYSIKVTFNNRGLLSYLSSDRDFRAINNYGSYLLPVCEVANFADKLSARNILMLEEGQVYLENGSWFVDKNNKVKIRFI